MEEAHCPGLSKRTNKMRVHIISSPRSTLYIYTNYANLEAMQYKANSTNELKINANITKGHKGKFRLRSTYACGWTDHFHIARWQFPVSSGSLSLNKCHISGRVSQTAGRGAVLGSSLAHGHQRSTICWEHTHFGQIFPAPAFVTTRLPEHNMPWKFPPLWLFALIFSEDEMINHCKSIRLLPEQLAAQRTWWKARYGPQKICLSKKTFWYGGL